MGKFYTTFLSVLFGLASLFLLAGHKANAQCFPGSSGVSVVYTITPLTCNGGTTGSVKVVVTGGGAPYTFTIAGSTISFQSITQATNTYTFTNLPADPSFFISVQTKITAGFAVCNFAGLAMTEPSAIAVIPSVTDVSCNGGSNGAISIAPSGGTPGYTYLWSNGAMTQNISGLAAGSYSVAVTDANGCPRNFNFTVNEPPPITILSSTADVTCSGGSNGSITITPSGGTPGYTYLWTNGATTQNVSGLSAGAYSVIVTDANGCPQVFNFTINQPLPITVTSSTTNVSCNGGSNGAINLTTVSGGTAPYTFLWSNGATTQNISGLTAGAYSVTVTDVNGCPQVFNFNITQPAPITTTSATTNVTCNGGSNGTISLTTISGGTAPYTFLWSNGATTPNVSGLAAGAYAVTVTDANGCPQVFNFNITQPLPIAITSSITNVTCNSGNNGAITLTTVSGGTGPYTFLWSNGATTQNITGLTAGAYSVTVTDANGCLQVFNFNISQPAAITVTSSITNVTCNGGSNGAITLTSVSGGTAPYTFLWSNGATTQNISGLSAGAYSVNITDANGCPQVFNFNITEPAVISITSTITNISCNGGSNGSITLNTILGGTAPYTFLWSNGATTQNILGLAVGAYSVTITDVNGCPQVFNFNITQPIPIAVTSSSTNVTCNTGSNGAISLITVSGGTAPYTFLWNNGATTQNVSGLTAGAYSVTVTDANGCAQVFNYNITQPIPIAVISSITNVTCNGGSNGAITLTTVSGGTGPYTFLWSNGATTQNISGLTAGAYSVTVTDANGCPQLFNFTITEPPPISVTSTISAPTCNGATNGAITLNSIFGGTAPYTFLWSNGAVTQNISGLAAGSYSVIITDAGACPGQVFNFTVTSPPVLTVVSNVTDATCNTGSDGTITLTTISGGTAPYTFLWSNGATTRNISGLTAGAYSVTITDANSCIQVLNFNISEPAPITITNAVTNVSCNSGSDGAITINTIAGGTAPYTFLWNTGATTQNITGLGVGTFSVTITDANSCTQVFNFNITEPTPIVITSTITSTTCNGGTDGTITLNTVTGATPSYTFLWSNGATTQNISGLTASAYSVTITDAIGCPQPFNFNVAEPTPIVVTSSVTNSSTCGGSDGAIDLLTVTGGTAPYTFLWSTGTTTQNITGLASGTYTVTITDANGCPQVLNFSISDPTPFTVTATATDITCNGANNGSIIHTITGGTAPFTVLWNTGATTQNLTGLSAGVYTVTITDASNCTFNGNYTINQPSIIAITSSTSNVTTCGGSDGSITINTVTGGTPGYTFLWNNGATTQNLSGLLSGNYSLTITDNNACTATYNFSISDPVTFTVNAVVVDLTCNGANNGSITHTITGGTAPFTILWNTGATTQNLSGLSGGSYTVTITDATNCSYNGNYIVNEPAAITITPIINNVTTCGGNDGAIDLLTVAGGTAPYTFLWSNGAITQNISGLTANSYSVTITDANGCPPSVFTFTVSDPVPYIVSDVIVNVTCNGSANGSIDLTITGGAAPFTILWSNGAMTEDLTGLTAGSYIVNITDAGGCSFTGNYTVTEPLAISITSAVTDVTCNAGSNGAIDILTFSGGIAPYTFLWNTGASTQNVASLSAGNYSITVTDANSCPQSFNFTIIEPAPITAAATLTNTTTCGGNDGFITINTISGGASPYTFSWSNGATTQNINSLSAANYILTITDASTCSQVFNYAVSDPTPYTITPTLTPVLCNGGTSGAINLNITGGTAPFTILWNNGASTPNISLLSAGTYTVSITDAGGCTFNANYVITEPAPLSVVSSVTNTSNCVTSDGAINLTIVSGGTPAYSFLWSNGATTQNISALAANNYSVTITDANTCNTALSFAVSNPTLFTVTPSITNLSCGSTSSGAIALAIGGTIIPPLNILWNTSATTAIISGLTAGSYTVDVSDASGCSFNGSYTITQPSSVDTASIIDTMNPVLCPGSNEGSIVLTNINGGASPYTFILNGISSPIPSFDTLTGGNYTMKIVDANGCTFYHSFTIFEPAPIAYSIFTTPSVCTNNDGSLTFGPVTGGTPTYLYSIDSGLTYTSQTVYASLAPNTFSVFVQDANLCTFGYTVPVILKPAPMPYFRIIPPTCNGGNDGAIVIDSLSGGVFPFTFYFNGEDRGSSKVFTDLTFGNYSIVIEDQECAYKITNYLLYNYASFDYDTLLDTNFVYVPQPAPITASVLYTDTYNKESTGIAVVYNIAGGTSPYQYSLDTTAGYNPLTDTLIALTGLDKGYYKVFLKDTNQCMAELTVHIKVGFFIPNLITPNSDGQNDYFEIMALPRNSTLSIFNSWNSRIYYDNNYNNSWEAKGESDGVYYYELVLPDGKHYKGWLQVLR
ncbi:MAG: gliding motility-associated C-terminal domain-containing protein [Cytophagaceae bacterium]|nr:gliding motility-associated C-terminal domain-containing protein [Cytophagaceae bacterium]